jgi:hypothetical protein
MKTTNKTSIVLFRLLRTKMIKNRKELERKRTKRSKSRRNVTKNKQKNIV